MLWSLIKILLFVAAITAATFGATWLMGVEGGAVVEIAGRSYSFSVLDMVVGALVLVALVWVLFKLIGLLVATFRFLNGDETAISRYFARNRERRGFEALSEGLMALASGEGRLAMAKAARADRYLDRPELTNVLTAQAAELAGDRKTAEATYRKLLEDERTRFVGVRGLLKQKLNDGDTDTALALAQKAFLLKPRHEETQDILLRLQAGQGDWSGARETLSTKLKTGSLPRDVHKRRDAVLAVSQARDVVEEGNTVEAREAAIEANRLSPDLVPAAVMAARGYIEQGNKRAAARIVKKAWAAQPHPDLAAAFAEIEPEENAAARLKRFNALLKVRPDHPESRMLAAELNIAAEDFPAARRALGDLVETDPTTRSLTIMAAIERGEGAADAVVRGWLAKALTAPRAEQWICENCHNIEPVWGPVCSNCGGFDTLAWTRPPKSELVAPTGTEMLPLIVGQIDDKAGEEEPEPEQPVAEGKEPEVIEAEIVQTPAEPTEETK